MLAAKFCPDPKSSPNHASDISLFARSGCCLSLCGAPRQPHAAAMVRLDRYPVKHGWGTAACHMLRHGRHGARWQSDAVIRSPVTGGKFGRSVFRPSARAMSWSIWPLHAPTSWWRGVWPLFCETDRVVDCFTSGRFLWRSDAQKWPRPVGASRRLCHAILPRPARPAPQSHSCHGALTGLSRASTPSSTTAASLPWSFSRPPVATRDSRMPHRAPTPD